MKESNIALQVCINDPKQADSQCIALANMLRQAMVPDAFGKMPVMEITVAPVKKKRGSRMNNCLHLYLTRLAAALNAAGLDMRKVMKPEVDIPWTQATAKEYLWRPIQELLTGEDSTKLVSNSDYQDIYDTLNSHLANKFGVSVDWPHEEIPID